MERLMRNAVIAGLLSDALFSTSASALTIDNSKAFGNYLMAMGDDDISGFVKGDDSLVGGEVTVLSASKIIGKYRNNELSADKEFKGKPVRIKTIASAIKTDFYGKAYIVATGSNQFESLHLRVNADDERIQKINRGDKVDFVCFGKGMIMNTPILDSCMFPKNFGHMVYLNIAKSFTQLSNRDYEPSSRMAAQILTLYIAAEKNISKECEGSKDDCLKAVKRVTQQEFKKEDLAEQQQAEIEKLAKLSKNKELPYAPYQPAAKTKLLEMLN